MKRSTLAYITVGQKYSQSCTVELCGSEESIIPASSDPLNRAASIDFLGEFDLMTYRTLNLAHLRFLSIAPIAQVPSSSVQRGATQTPITSRWAAKDRSCRAGCTRQ